MKNDANLTSPASDPRFLPKDDESHVRERIQKAEQGHSLRPGALCPHCSGHAFKRAELKAGTPCPNCGKSPRVAA